MYANKQHIKIILIARSADLLFFFGGVNYNDWHMTGMQYAPGINLDGILEFYHGFGCGFGVDSDWSRVGTVYRRQVTHETQCCQPHYVPHFKPNNCVTNYFQ